MSLDPHPPAGDTIYTERRFSLRAITLPLRGGRTARRGVIVHGGSVVLLPITADDEIVFIHNRRWQLGKRLLELPAGTLAPGEAPAICAARELIEETGYRAHRLEPLPAVFALPGLTTEVMHVYLARDLTFVGQQLEPDEDIEVERVPLAEAQRRLVSGEIVDMKTLAILGRYLLTR